MNARKYLTLASAIHSLCETWERQDQELEAARSYLEQCDRPYLQECAENIRIADKREIQMRKLIEEHLAPGKTLCQVFSETTK